METIVVVDHHCDEYQGQRRGSGKGFRGINCRTFHSGGNTFLSPSLNKKSYLASPRTPPPSVNSQLTETKQSKRIVKSNTISFPIRFKVDLHKEGFFGEGFSYSELWAGPAYSNSPPPSDLPIPKFSLQSKCSVSLELPNSPQSDIDIHPNVKSAPPSPSRNHKSALEGDVFHGADSATKTLCRILNLDI